jgi:hypothetical protein
MRCRENLKAFTSKATQTNPCAFGLGFSKYEGWLFMKVQGVKLETKYGHQPALRYVRF